MGSRIASGAFVLWLANNMFDWVAYPLVMCTYGNWQGAVIMALAAIPFNYALIKGYDSIGIDLLGIEALKEFQSTEHESWHKRLLKKVLSRGKIGTFIFMSLYDPIPATLYIRQGTRSYKGLVGNDWWWFGVSNIIANASWAILMMIGIVTLEATTGACAQ
jgi:hypothetical protein